MESRMKEEQETRAQTINITSNRIQIYIYSDLCSSIKSEKWTVPYWTASAGIQMNILDTCISLNQHWPKIKMKC